MARKTVGGREASLARGLPRITANSRSFGRIKFVKSRRESKN